MSAYADIDRFQEEQAEWARHNFGHTEPRADKPLRGVVEEVGELQEAQDAELADVLIKQAALNRLHRSVARLCHFDLKGEQRIRYTPEQIAAKKKDAVGDVLIYLVDYCTVSSLSMGESLDEAWSEVRQRDWVADPISAAEAVRAEMDNTVSVDGTWERSKLEEDERTADVAGQVDDAFDLPTPAEARSEDNPYGLEPPPPLLPEGAVFDSWGNVHQVFEVVYISSAMTGIVNYNAERFAAVREDLRSTGRYAVLCPSQRGERDLDKPRSHHMRRDFQDVLNSKGVFVFDEWWRSPGSRAEVVVALEIGHWVHVYDPLAEDRKGPEVTMDDYRKFWAEAINA